MPMPMLTETAEIAVMYAPGTTSALIHRISAASNRYGDLLIRFMERYLLSALKDAQDWQLREFINTEIGGDNS